MDKLKFKELFIRSNKPNVFQSYSMTPGEFGGQGCNHLEVTWDCYTIQVDAVHTQSERVVKTSILNWNDVAEFYGERV